MQHSSAAIGFEEAEKRFYIAIDVGITERTLLSRLD
jgi:hypothetical protein